MTMPANPYTRGGLRRWGPIIALLVVVGIIVVVVAASIGDDDRGVFYVRTERGDVRCVGDRYDDPTCDWDHPLTRSER